MSEYSELVKNFFLRYEKPEVDEYIVGFSGIDPPLKNTASGVTLNHEDLDDLLGGSVEDGHYHLTQSQLASLRNFFGTLSIDGGYATTSEDEYAQTSQIWIDGGTAGW